MITILLGIISSTVAEVVTALNKKLTGTVLQGDAAFIIAFGISAVGAFIKEIMLPGFTWSDFTHYSTLVSDFAQVFAVSQIYFIFITKKLGLDVQDPTTTVVTTTQSTVAASLPNNAGAASSEKILG